MRLTTFTDYCLRVLTFVGTKGSGPATIDEIAGHYGISRNHVMKVVLRLGQCGYLETTRGKGGGMRLGMAPEEVNLGALIREVEVDTELVECFESGGGDCRIASVCVLRSVLHEALEAFFAVLDRYTLADLLAPKSDLARLLALPQPGGA